jgi:hypothetical protein
MNAAMTAENRGLLDDNKQLNALIKEYEQTLDMLMSTSYFSGPFRGFR